MPVARTEKRRQEDVERYSGLAWVPFTGNVKPEWDRYPVSEAMYNWQWFDRVNRTFTTYPVTVYLINDGTYVLKGDDADALSALQRLNKRESRKRSQAGNEPLLPKVAAL